MSNEITKPATANVAKAEAEKSLKLQSSLLNQLETGAAEMGQPFSPYGKQCVVNAIAALILICKSKNIDLSQIDGTMVRLALQNIGYTELNVAAIPSECYFDLRKSTTDGKTTYAVSIKPQGAGNEKLVRKYGVGIKPNGLMSAWLVRDGDEFIYPSYDGIQLTPPKWIRKVGDDKKVMLVVYPVLKDDGSQEYLIATREGIKPNLIAQIRQNALYAFKKENVNPKTGKKWYESDDEARDDFYKRIDAEFENLSVDQILADPEWMQWVNPTYTSGGSKEAMVIRKMKNNALKNYPKEYDNVYIANAVTNMFEDKDDSVLEAAPAAKKSVEETIDATQKEIDEKPVKEAAQDFQVDEDTGEVIRDSDLDLVDDDIPEPKTADHFDEEDDYGF